MAKRKTKKNDDSGYSFIYAQVTKYTAAVDSSVNYEARDDRWRHSDTKVYSFQTRLEIEARCLYSPVYFSGVPEVKIYIGSGQKAKGQRH